MPRRTLDRIREAIRSNAYDMTAHTFEEMAEDGLDLVDIETAILNGRLTKTAKDDPRGIRHTIHGIGAMELHSLQGDGGINMTAQFGYRCEYCEGTVREKRVEREAFKHKTGFVILEDVVIGVCDKCGNRYYSADTLKRVQAIASGKIRPTRTVQVPVATAR